MFFYIDLLFFCRSIYIKKPCQTKIALKKFMDSMLQKSGKIRALVKELETDYSASTLMTSWLFSRYIIYKGCHPQIPLEGPCQLPHTDSRFQYTLYFATIQGM